MAKSHRATPDRGGGRGAPDAPRLALHRCENAHSFFFPHSACPFCGRELRQIEAPPNAVIVSRTVVRVGPTESPFVLGLARTAEGAQTLCIVEVGADVDPGTDVVITKRGGLYYASPRPRAV